MFEKLKGFFSPNRTISVRKHLQKSLERGPIYDFKEIMNTEGKVWTKNSATDFVSEKSNQKVPAEFKIGNFFATDFFRQNRVTLLAVSYSSFSDQAIDSFLSKIPINISKVIIRPILNPLKWILWSKLVSRTDNAYLLRGDIPHSIEVFGMENKYAGYVFLIDTHGIIRWKAAGSATIEELDSMQKQIKLLTNS